MSEARVQAIFNIEPFEPSMNWERWVRRLEGVFKLFKVEDDNKVPYLLHYIGASAFDVISNKCAPDDPYTCTYRDLVEKLRQFYAPAPLEIAENFRFHQRRQKEGESILQYVAALQQLSLNCNFGVYLKTALRNQFVFGVTSTRIQSRLLETEDLTFDKAVELATGMEMSAKDTDQLQGSTATVQVADNKKFQRRSSNYQPKHTKKTQQPRSIHTPTNSKNPSNTNYSNSKNISCFRCGKGHLATKCNLNRNIRCAACGVQGHLQSGCFKNKGQTHNVEEILYNATDNDVLQLEQARHRDKFLAKLQVNNKILEFEVDSGAAVTIANKTHMLKLFPSSTIQPTTLKLTTYCKNTLKTEGYITVHVQYGNMVHQLNIYLTNVSRIPLLGREWLRQLLNDTELRKISLNHCTINAIETDKKVQLNTILQKCKEILEPGLGRITNKQARLTLKDNAKPIYVKHRTIPFKLLPLVEKEIQNLEATGILKKVNTSEWATPIVPVLKKEGTVRICGDYSITTNPNLIVDDHPLPTIDELFASMAGGTTFTKIDLRQAYLQLEVREEDQALLTLNTPWGLYKPTRLMYGIASAPAIWQREIENILKGIPGVTVFLDDIKITGTSDAEHLHRLELVFQRLNEYNIKINLEKSTFFTNQIKYCGYIIDKNGIHKDSEKIEAIEKMPTPRNVSEVRSFIGFVNYYGRFIKNLSSILHPLNKLLHKESKFICSKECEVAFRNAKRTFQSNEILAHYDPKLPLILATDASSYGVGAVLSHVYPDGSERVIQYASSTLNDTQKKYAQIDKEAYSIIFGVKKFHQYLYGNKFTLYTDHRPLVHIFAPSKSLPIYSAMRMQHYALFLRGFNYTIKYKNTKLHSNADCLSRLPIANQNNTTHDVVDIHQIDTIQSLPVTFNELIEATKQNASLKQIVHAIETGTSLPKNDKFRGKEVEFSVKNGVLLRRHRVVIPKMLQPKILKELHNGHFGIVKMKMLARSYVWVDRNNPPKIKHTWEPATFPFERVHIDIAGPFKGHNFLIIVDAYTKWPEVFIVNNITADTTIQKCREAFARFGLPMQVVSDNGRTFVSDEFQKYLQNNGITQKLTAPYNPATNGLAERFVQTLKKALRTINTSNSNLQAALQRILMQYRITPHCTTGTSPAELMYNRKIRCSLDIMCTKNDEKGQEYDVESVRNFKEGERVSCRNYQCGDKWIFGRILKRIGTLHYTIKLDDGRTWKRHINQMRPIGEYTPSRLLSEDKNPSRYIDYAANTDPQQAVDPLRNNRVEEPCVVEQPINVQQIRRSDRTRAPPMRYGDFRVH
ncbi:uncharacterized protein K02A2.6-like [Osmia bicornis bicornis]|uniref:uncharacterized protein K02A2.6-like n=1 Tax=Osmia bicornis bicornis TaxID=1437191 RepID=UPI001EAE958D|nr:uncharacterized protein K02A2.6-like [Osmia bicornis bicornis]